MTKAFLIKIIFFSIIIQTTSIFGKGPENCVPVAKWSGQLLFDEKNREEDGSIRIKMENTPEEFKSLKGEVLKLQFGKESSSARRWFPCHLVKTTSSLYSELYKSIDFADNLRTKLNLTEFYREFGDYGPERVVGAVGGPGGRQLPSNFGSFSHGQVVTNLPTSSIPN